MSTSINTFNYIESCLERIVLMNNFPKHSTRLYIQTPVNKIYPTKDIVLYADVEHLNNPVINLMTPYLKGKINMDYMGCYITLDKPIEYKLSFDTVLYYFYSEIEGVKDNELASINDIMNMIDLSVDEYDGNKLVSKGKPSLIDGDMKLRLTNIPYNIRLSRTITSDYQNLFNIKVDTFDKFNEEFSLILFDEEKELNLEVNCLINEKQHIITSTKNYSTSKYIYTSDIQISKETYKKINGDEGLLNMLSINLRIKNISEKPIYVEIVKKNISNIITDINKLIWLKNNTNILNFNGIEDISFNKTNYFYSSDITRYNLFDNDLPRLAKPLQDINLLKSFRESGVYLCGNNFGEKLPLDIPKELIKGLWYLEVINIYGVILQTIYDLSDITIVLSRKSLDNDNFSDWSNVYHLQHKHKAEDIEENDTKRFVDNASIDRWNKTTEHIKYTNILSPVINIGLLPKSTEDSPIEEYSLCYVKQLKTYLVFDGGVWNNIDDTIIDYTDSIDLNDTKNKCTILIKETGCNIFRSLLDIDYDCNSAIVYVTGNTDTCYQTIRITDINGKLHEYIRTLIKTDDGNDWSYEELIYSGHKHNVDDIVESEDKFFMTLEDKNKISEIENKGIKKVNSILDLYLLNDVENNSIYKTSDTKIIYCYDKPTNMWLPISINSLTNIDDETQIDYLDIESGLLSKKYYRKLKTLFDEKTISYVDDSLVFSKSKHIGKNSIDLVIRSADTDTDTYSDTDTEAVKLLEKLGNNSVAIGKDIYKYRSKSVLIGNNLESHCEESVMIGSGLYSTKTLFVFGKYNIDGDYALVFGNGNSINNKTHKSNLFTVDNDGLFETSEKGGYAIKNGLIESVLLANGKNISIYELYRIIGKMLKTEPDNINETVMIPNSEGTLDSEGNIIMVEKTKIVETRNNSMTSEILNKLIVNRNKDIENKTFSI